MLAQLVNQYIGMLIARQPYFAGIFSEHFRTPPSILGGGFFENFESLGQRMMRARETPCHGR